MSWCGYTATAPSQAPRCCGQQIELLTQDAGRREFDAVYAEALDRISRDQEDVAGFFKRMRFAAVTIVTLAEGEISELHVGLKGTMNALFLKDLAEKTRRGLQGRVLQGLSGGGICYGYDLVPGETGVRRINEVEAEVIRAIFRDYAAGLSPRAIARRLNEKAIPGPSSRPWRDTAIRGHFTRGTGILNNELYVGRLVWNSTNLSEGPRNRASSIPPQSSGPMAHSTGTRCSASSRVPCGRRLRRGKEPSGRVIEWPMRVPHAFGKSAGPTLTCSAVASIAKSAAVPTPRSGAITSPAPLLAAAATVLTVKASVGARWRD